MAAIYLNDYLPDPATCSTGYWQIEELLYFPAPNNNYNVSFQYSSTGVNNLGQLLSPVPLTYTGLIITLPPGANTIWIDFNYPDKEYIEIKASYLNFCNNSACPVKQEINIRVQNNLVTNTTVAATPSTATIGLDRLSGASNRYATTTPPLKFEVGLIVDENNQFNLQFYKTVKGTGVYSSGENTLETINISNEVAPVWSYYVCQDYNRNDLVESIIYDLNIQCYLTGLSLTSNAQEIQTAIKDGYRYGITTNTFLNTLEIENFIKGITVETTISPTNLITIKVNHKPHYCISNSWGIIAGQMVTSTFTTASDFTDEVVVNPPNDSTTAKTVISNNSYCTNANNNKLNSIIPALNFVFYDNDDNKFSSTGEVAQIYINQASPVYVNQVTHRKDLASISVDKITALDTASYKTVSCTTGTKVKFCHGLSTINLNDMLIYKNNIPITGMFTLPNACSDLIDYVAGDEFRIEVITTANPPCTLTKIFNMT